MSSLHLLSMFPHTHFSPVCEFLADFEDSHTAKTGLLRCCLYISSSSVNSSCLLCCRGKLYSPNKEKILARQSSLHFLIFFFLLLRTFLHSRGPLPLLNAFFFAFFDLATVQDFLFHSFSQIHSALVYFTLAQTFPFFTSSTSSSTALTFSFISSVVLSSFL